MMWGEKKLKKGDEGEKRSEIEGCGELVEERRNDEDIELRKDKFGKDKIEIDEERDRRLKRKWINEGKKEENDISYEDRNVEGDGKNKGMNGWKVEKEWGKKVIEKEYMKKNWSEEYEDDEEEDKGIEGGYEESEKDSKGGEEDKRKDNGDNGNEKIGEYGWKKMGKGKEKGGEDEVNSSLIRCDSWMICNEGS